MPTASIILEFEYEEHCNGMWNPSLYLTYIIRIIYNSHPSRRTAKFWNENVFFKFIDLIVPDEDYGKPISFFRHIFCTISSIECPLNSFSVVSFQRRSFRKDKPASTLIIIIHNMNLSIKEEIIDFGMKRIFVEYFCYINSPPLFSCDTLGVEHSNLQNKRFHHQINQTIYSII